MTNQEKQDEISWGWGFDESVKSTSGERKLAQKKAFNELAQWAKALVICQCECISASNKARKMGIISEQEFDAICKKIYSDKYTKSYWDTFQA